MTPFAEMTAAMNAAIGDLLADAEADFGGAVGVVSGIYRQDYTESFGMVGGSRTVFECLAPLVASVERGSSVTIAGTAFSVAEIEPDGNGWIRLFLK